MTYFQKTKGAHYHKFFVDANTGDRFCVCGVQKGEAEKRAKYHNRSSIYNGVSYHSGLEARYAFELDMRLRAKQIRSWERQVKIDLRVNGHHINNYYIDFIVHEKDGSRGFVECKGMELEPWKTNWKILEATFESFKKHPDDYMLVVKEQNNWKKRALFKTSSN